MPQKTKSTKAYIVACMNCHGGKGTLVYTLEAAQTEANIHLAVDGGHKDHSGHEVTITETKVVRRKGV